MQAKMSSIICSSSSSKYRVSVGSPTARMDMDAPGMRTGDMAGELHEAADDCVADRLKMLSAAPKLGPRDAFNPMAGALTVRFIRDSPSGLTLIGARYALRSRVNSGGLTLGDGDLRADTLPMAPTLA